jgi:hypothetical protein
LRQENFLYICSYVIDFLVILLLFHGYSVKSIFFNSPCPSGVMMDESRLERGSHFPRRGRVRDGPRLKFGPMQHNLISARRREHLRLHVAENESGGRFDVVVRGLADVVTRRTMGDVTGRKRRRRKRRRENLLRRMTRTAFRGQTSEHIWRHRKIFLIASVGAAITQVSVLRDGQWRSGSLKSACRRFGS